MALKKGPLFYKNSDSFGLMTLRKEKKVTLREFTINCAIWNCRCMTRCSVCPFFRA